ncbi:MAG: AAA family ATPase [Prevotellaceae bacterium]|jgi:hypothetical protein|nr:AAA family ATPase [Prevotellaceae bacterium]
MKTIQKALPIGIQTFATIREEDCIYVDKTKYLVDLIDDGKLYYLARPQGFGKSLTVTTLEAMFSGKKELFKGLYAEEFMNRPNYRPSPVIRLDMTTVMTSKGIKDLSQSLKWIVASVAEDYDIDIPNTYPPGDAFDDLIHKVAKQGGGKVVILVDEFDKPYSDFYTNPQMAEEARRMMENFYIRIKANDEYIRFVFLTGIARFTRFSGFSTLNNITDISLDEEYGEICGLSETEIEKYFPEHITETAKEMKISPKELLEKKRNYYFGFCFDGVHQLYNPLSTLHFFWSREFYSYWIQMGSVFDIDNYFKEKHLTVEQFRNFFAPYDFLDVPGDMDNTSPGGFMYQAGYLTVRRKEGLYYKLDYPNTEVLNSMSEMFVQHILSPAKYLSYRAVFLVSLEDKKIEFLTSLLNTLLSSIHYSDYTGAIRHIKLNPTDIEVREWLYRSTIIALFRGCNVATVAEMQTSLEHPDLVISYQENTYVIELKVAYTPEDVPAKLAEAVEQIQSKNYLALYPEAMGLAMVIDDTKRQITETKII